MNRHWTGGLQCTTAPADEAVLVDGFSRSNGLAGRHTREAGAALNLTGCLGNWVDGDVAAISPEQATAGDTAPASAWVRPCA